MNNNFSKLGKQLLDIWGQLGASQRVSVLAATFMLLAGLGTVTFWSLSVIWPLAATLIRLIFGFC